MIDYVQQALRTESPITQELLERVAQNARLIHGAMGLCTETGEFTDGLKRDVFYGKPIDPVNVKEELGDILWYMAIIMDFFGLTFEEVMEANIAKLRKRYPEKFTEADAINRDLGSERVALESGDTPKRDSDSVRVCGFCGSRAIRMSTMNPGKVVCNTCGKTTT